jgi:hypothetical protein
MLSCYTFYQFPDGSMMIKGCMVRPFRFIQHTNFSVLPITIKFPTQSIIQLDYYRHIERVKKVQKNNNIKQYKPKYMKKQINYYQRK